MTFDTVAGGAGDPAPGQEEQNASGDDEPETAPADTSAGQAAGGVWIALVLVAIAAAGFIFFLLYKRRKKEEEG